jgi:phosphohistidine phosphatase
VGRRLGVLGRGVRGGGAARLAGAARLTGRDTGRVARGDPTIDEEDTMELILWRHAQAEDTAESGDDLDRALTVRGAKDAERVAGWLLERIPEGAATVLASPARRTRQTADALRIPYGVLAALAPGAAAADVIAASGWPERRAGTLIVVGHQPWIGEAVATIVAGRPEPWPVRKAGFWWLSWRTRGERGEPLVRAAMSPELLR